MAVHWVLPIFISLPMAATFFPASRSSLNLATRVGSRGPLARRAGGLAAAAAGLRRTAGAAPPSACFPFRRRPFRAAARPRRSLWPGERAAPVRLACPGSPARGCSGVLAALPGVAAAEVSSARRGWSGVAGASSSGGGSGLPSWSGLPRGSGPGCLAPALPFCPALASSSNVSTRADTNGPLARRCLGAALVLSWQGGPGAPSGALSGQGAPGGSATGAPAPGGPSSGPSWLPSSSPVPRGLSGCVLSSAG